MLMNDLAGVLLLTLSALFPPPSGADTLTPAAALTERLQSFKTINATFEQVVEDEKGREIQKSQGHVSIQKPNLFRWEIETPFQQVIIAKDKTIWIYDKSLEQATRQSVEDSIGKTPALLLTGNAGEFLKDFAVKRNSPSGTLDWFEVIPKPSKTRENMFSRLLLGFAGNTLKKMMMTDNLDQHSYIFFRNVKLNAPLSKEHFSFTPPAGVDVIDNTP